MEERIWGADPLAIWALLAKVHGWVMVSHSFGSDNAGWVLLPACLAPPLVPLALGSLVVAG